MEEDRLTYVSQLVCEHVMHRKYSTSQYDVLNGFEIIATKCSNCHKTLSLEVKKIG